MEDHDGHRVCTPALLRGLCCNTETQGNVTHGVDYHTVVCVGTLSDPCKTRLEHVVAIQELLFCAWFEPHLLFRIRCHVIQGGDVQVKLARLGELAEASAHADEVLPSYVVGQLHDLFAYVIDSVFMEPKAVSAIWPVNEKLDILRYAVEKKMQERRKYLVCTIEQITRRYQ